MNGWLMDKSKRDIIDNLLDKLRIYAEFYNLGVEIQYVYPNLWQLVVKEVS